MNSEKQYYVVLNGSQKLLYDEDRNKWTIFQNRATKFDLDTAFDFANSLMEVNPNKKITVEEV